MHGAINLDVQWVVPILSLLAVVGNAAISHWRVGSMSRDLEELRDWRLHITRVEGETDSAHEDYERRLTRLERKVFGERNG